jgi:hypothetical protein
MTDSAFSRGMSKAETDKRISDLEDALGRSNKALVRAKEKTDRMVEAALQGAHDAAIARWSDEPIVARVDSSASGKPEAALWHMTDWQGSKKTTSYNSQVMEERIMAFCGKAVAITEIQRAHHPVDDCAIAFGGDMIEGLFNFPTQPFEVDATIFKQFVTVAALIERVIRLALEHYNTVTVVAEWGNHGRMGSKRDAIPRSDNIDRMVYELARQNLKNEPRVIWDEHHGEEDIQHLEIGNYRALVIHGDEIGRNGFASPAAFMQAAVSWQSGAHDWPFRDIYVGHYHQHAEYPFRNGLGSLFYTGSTESDNRYASVSMAASARPSQRLHFIDPDKGLVTAQYKIYLD